MSDDDDSSSDDEKEEPTAMAYPMMMPYGYAAYPSAYSFAASAQAYPGYTYQAGYPGYGSAEYAAYMQSMSAAGYATGSSSGTPGIATDPMSAYYGAAGYGAGPSFQYGTVKTFIPEKGFGFIESALPSEGDVFFSKTELSSDLQSESQTDLDLKGKPVQFEVTMGKDNRSRAVNVQLCSLELVQRAAKNAPKPKGSPSSGTIKSFSERHGYGFLALENGNGDAQFRGSDLAPELLALGSALAGRMVKCQIHELRDGKVKATDMVPIPGQAGKGKSSGKGKTQALQRVRGKVKTFNPDTRHGTASCTENSDDVTFFDLKNLQLVEGAEVSFLLKMLADGSAQGMDLCLGDSDVKAEPKPLMDGTTITATVKSFNDTRGFGFLKIPGANVDLYFHGRDMDEASQGLLMMVGASGLANCNATCRAEARTDGRWNGRNVSLLEAGVQMMDGLKMAGMIRYFYDHKGFGFINVTGNPIDIYFQGRDVGPDAQTRCEKMGAVGTVVWFTVYAQTDSRWQAKDIVLAGDGSSVGGLTPDMLGGKGWGKGESDPYSESYGWEGYDGWDGWGGGSAEYGKGSGKGSGKASLPKVEKQIIPGCELVGRLKSYNAEKHFGFISVDGQPNDVYFQVWDLVDTLKSQVETLGADGSGLSAGALVRFSLQLMPGGGRLRARDMTLSPSATLSTAADVEAAVQKAAAVAHEAIIPGSGSILHDGAQVSGKVRIFNQDRGFGFVTVDADETDLYFHIKDMLQEDQQKVSNGLKLPGQRVWFWAEMLDNSMSGRWRCHDISLTFRRAATGTGGTGTSGPPAKRQKTDGAGSGQKVNGS